MKDKRRVLLGSLFFALMFFYIGIHSYFVFVPFGSYAGWFGKWEGPGHPVQITGTDPKGPATALQAGDEFLAINGITPAQDPEIIGFDGRVPPGTTFLMTVRRDNQELVVPITTVEKPADRDSYSEKASILIHLIFLATGLVVFLLKPDDRQAWLLALMLGTFVGLFSWNMPVALLGRGAELLVAVAKILGLWSVPLYVRFFLEFPERSPILRRWPKLEAYLNWPFYLFILPYIGGGRLPSWLKAWYYSLPPIQWLGSHSWFGLPMPVLAGYLAAGLVCLVVNYRVADRDTRRRLRVVVIGSGAAVLTLLLDVGSEFLGVQDRIPGLDRWLEIGMLVFLPLIPLSFAYAIIRHKVIPISLIIRRSARYVLVSRGSVVLEIVVVFAALTFFLTTFFNYLRPSSGIVIGVISGVVAVVVWNVFSALHRRVIAPAIDRRFFRESYDARQILAELSQSVRSTTDSKQLLELVCTRIQKALHVENVTVLLRDDASGDYASAVSFNHQANGKPAAPSQMDVRLPADAHAVRQLNESGGPLHVDFSDPSPSPPERLTAAGNGSSSEKETLERLNTALLLPLAAKDRMLGVISLGPRLGDQSFSREDEQMLMSVVGQTTFAIENTRLIEHMIDEERRRQELEAENEQRIKELEEARQLQLSMLPKTVPQLPCLEIAAYMKTATEVGGDYYDFHLADDGTLTVAVGDATGHGLKAGTMVTAFKSLFGAFAQHPDLVHIFQQTNCALKRMNMRSLFMSVTMLKVKGHRLTVSIAGMPSVLVYRAASGVVEEIAIRGMPLGSVANYPYKQQEMTISTGDVVVLMSDGLPERFNADNEMLDYASTKRAFATAAAQSPQAIIEHFVNVGEAWAGGRPQDDDVTFVVLKVRDGRDAVATTPVEKS